MICDGTTDCMMACRVTALIFNTFSEVFLKDSSHLGGEALESVNFIMPKNVKSRE